MLLRDRPAIVAWKANDKPPAPELAENLNKRILVGFNALVIIGWNCYGL